MVEFSQNQRVVWWQGPTAGRLTACRGTVIELVGSRAKVSLDDGRNRAVPIARLQSIRKAFMSIANPYVIPPEPPLDEWGHCTLHAEIAEDLYPARYLYEFANGNFLCYDRNHWFDDFGSLGTLAFCEFRWMEYWSMSTETEFQELWNRGAHQQAKLGLERHLPDELANVKPWKRSPVQSVK